MWDVLQKDEMKINRERNWRAKDRHLSPMGIILYHKKNNYDVVDDVVYFLFLFFKY